MLFRSKRQILVIEAIAVVWISLVGCRSSERTEPMGRSEPIPGKESSELTDQSKAMPSREMERLRSMPNPSAVYCVRLGYKYKTVLDDEGNQYGLCIFPDGDACRAWDFYRGKCNQECSYCKQHGYELKELDRNEGWAKGAVCIDKTTKEKAGTVFDLMGMDMRKSLPESPRR